MMKEHFVCGQQGCRLFLSWFGLWASFPISQWTLMIDTSKCPSYWSKFCLHNIAGLAKEATTIRRVLEPMLRYYDMENHWPFEKGLALFVLSDLQLLMEKTVKHLDHKNVVKQPSMQIDVIRVTTHLAQCSKQQASVAIIGAIGDLMKLLRRCMQCSVEASDIGDDPNKSKCNSSFSTGGLSCTSFRKVGDGGPILDMMVVVLESLPASPIVARTTVSSVYRIALIVSSIPNVSYHKKAFPEALFLQLLLTMTHPDHEARVGAHRVLSAVLVPSLVCAWSNSQYPVVLKGCNPLRTLSISLSGFSSTATMEKAEKSFPVQEKTIMVLKRHC